METYFDSPLYEGPPVFDEDVVAIAVVVNGSLGMSRGKIASQVFTAGLRVGRMRYRVALWPEWAMQGRRVTLRIAETEGVFHRVLRECMGFTIFDEGLTEVKRGAMTCYVVAPYKRGETPPILNHKRCPLL